MNLASNGQDALAEAVLEDISSGMSVGLGTGITADRVTRALAKRVASRGLIIECVCTSAATMALAKSLGLHVVPFADVERIDYLFDGASEVDSALRMLKGHHGAITRQRLVAEVADKCVYLTSEERCTQKLGSKALLSATIIPFGIASIRSHLRHIGLSGVIRRTMDGQVVETEGGGVVIDMTMPDRDPEELAAVIDRVSGVVDHGIFLDEADEVLVECKNGEIKRLVRGDE
jgi:ribose 5-phosphate isomerase A